VTVIVKDVHTKIGETTIYKRRNNTQKIHKHRIHKIENKYTKQANINMSRVISK